MNRKQTTEFLKNLLKKEKFSGIGKYWASEVSIDYGTTDVKRVDFMQFEPAGIVGVSGIEKGIFICYEIKSCKADFESGFGRNFIGEKNYFVMPMSTYKEVMNDIPYGIGVLVPIPKYADRHEEFENPTALSQDTDWKHIPYGIGVLVPIPKYADRHEEFENPTALSQDTDWKLCTMIPVHSQLRKRSMVELLFCMLRSGKRRW